MNSVLDRVPLQEPQILTIERENFEGEVCSICLEKVDIDYKPYECKHKFHQKCSEKWKKEYGEKTLVLLQVGSFFESYGLIDKENKILENKSPAMAELLRVLLKLCAEKYGVAQKIIATTYDLDKIASGSNNGPVFEGWRYDIFGKNALLLCEGKIGLAADGNKIKIVHVN